MKEVKNDVAELKTEMKEVKSDVAELKTGMKEVKTDVAELKTEMKEVKTDVAELKTDVVELKADVKNVKTDILQLKEDVVELKVGISVLDGALRQVRLCLETEMRPQLRNITDCYVATFERYYKEAEKLPRAYHDIDTLKLMLKEQKDIVNNHEVILKNWI